jgi:hypothetical protein
MSVLRIMLLKNLLYQIIITNGGTTMRESRKIKTTKPILVNLYEADLKYIESLCKSEDISINQAIRMLVMRGIAFVEDVTLQELFPVTSMISFSRHSKMEEYDA